MTTIFQKTAQVNKQKLHQIIYVVIAVAMLAGIFLSDVFAASDVFDPETVTDFNSESIYYESIYYTEEENKESYYHPREEEYYGQSIVPFNNLCCSNVNVTASGHMGDVTSGNTPSLISNTALPIPGAPWEFCDNCGTVTIAGGGIQTPNNTNTLSQSRFPGTLKPYIERIVFTEPVTAGSSLHDLFNGLINLIEIINIDYINSAATQNMRRMFYNTRSLVSLDLSNFYTGNSTNMYRMFTNTGAQSLNLGGIFNTGGLVTNYGSMFWGANNLATIGDTSNWNTAGATRMSRMFQGASSLTHIDASSWDTSNVALMYNMFHDARSLTTFGDISNWDVRNVLRMDNLFNGMTLTNLDLSNWVTESLARTDNMFDNSTRYLVSLDLSNFITSGVVNRNNMFNSSPGALALRKITLGPGWYWNAFNGTGLPNPPNNAIYTGYWIQVGTGTADTPAGPETATSAQLLDNSRDNIADTWVWQRVTPLHLVTFDLTGGTGNFLQQLIPNGKTAAEPADIPTLTGYTFIGWFTQLTEGEKFNFDTPITGNTVVFARWEPLPDDGYKGNGGNDYSDNNTYYISGNNRDGSNTGGYVGNFNERASGSGSPLPLQTPRQGTNPLENRPDLLLSPILTPISPGAVTPEAPTAPYEELLRRHFVVGYPDGTFQPDGYITRAEMIQIFFNISPVTSLPGTESRFSDIGPGNWFFQAVAYLEQNGSIQGFPDGSLRPNQPVSNGEFAAMMVKHFNLGDLIVPDMIIENKSHWAANHVNLGFAGGWLEYFGIAETFDPDASIPRNQAVAFFNFYQGRKPCPYAINTFLENSRRAVFPDLILGHWSFYEVMEAAFTRYYHFDSGNNEVWTHVLN